MSIPSIGSWKPKTIESSESFQRGCSLFSGTSAALIRQKFGFLCDLRGNQGVLGLQMDELLQV